MYPRPASSDTRWVLPGRRSHVKGSSKGFLFSARFSGGSSYSKISIIQDWQTWIYAAAEWFLLYAIPSARYVFHLFYRFCFVFVNDSRSWTGLIAKTETLQRPLDYVRVDAEFEPTMNRSERQRHSSFTAAKTPLELPDETSFSQVDLVDFTLDSCCFNLLAKIICLLLMPTHLLSYTSTLHDSVHDSWTRRYSHCLYPLNVSFRSCFSLLSSALF